jgi:hypothetical protein
MDYLKLIVDEEGLITECISEGDVKLSFDGIIAFCMSFMESASKDFLRAHPDEVEDLYDSLDYLFYKFMGRTFPDVQPRDFDLSDAGLLYAQDKIIEDAAKKGITYDEALKKYEEKAKKYVRKKARLMV